MADIPRIRTPTPSTPPFLNLASPDLKSFKSFLRSPATNGGKDELQFTEMDFEAAYAILTKSPNVGISSNFLNNHVPGASPKSFVHPQALRHDDLEFKDVLFKSSTPPPQPPQKSNIPDQPQNFMDFDSLYFPKYDELLSQNESNALEQFLDSMMEDKERASKPELDPTIATISEIQENHHLLVTQTIPIEQPDLHVSVPIEHKPIPFKRSSVNEESSKRKKRKKLLTEEEKKLNHTTSEQRRRGIIKEAFDELTSLLPFDMGPKKRTPSKSVVLEKAAFEIEKMQMVNEKLKTLLGQ